MHSLYDIVAGLEMSTEDNYICGWLAGIKVWGILDIVLADQFSHC